VWEEEKSVAHFFNRASREMLYDKNQIRMPRLRHAQRKHHHAYIVPEEEE
jgi:hypothetical protein